jgi:hypothetical protein
VAGPSRFSPAGMCLLVTAGGVGDAAAEVSWRRRPKGVPSASPTQETELASVSASSGFSLPRLPPSTPCPRRLWRQVPVSRGFHDPRGKRGSGAWGRGESETARRQPGTPLARKAVRSGYEGAPPAHGLPRGGRTGARSLVDRQGEPVDAAFALDANRLEQLVGVVHEVADRHRLRLEQLKERAADLERPDFLWHHLLQSFSTMGSSRGWAGLIGTPERYDRVRFDVVAPLAGPDRVRHLEGVLREAKVRMPHQKAVWLDKNCQRILERGGLEACRRELLATLGRKGKIAYLRGFYGIGPKYARNIMMDVFHPDFREAIAVDARIEQVLQALGVRLTRYEEKEAFWVDVARRASLPPWELDRCLYEFTKEVLAGLEGVEVHSHATPNTRESGTQHAAASPSAGPMPQDDTPSCRTALGRSRARMGTM